MGQIIMVQFRGSLPPRRLRNDGWWLEASPRRRVIAFPNRHSPGGGTAPTRRVRYLTLITNPGK